MLLYLVSLAAIVASCVLCVSIGTLLERDYTKYAPLPTTADQASSLGFAPFSSHCELHLGVPYTQTGGKPDESKPITLYFTRAGQVSGISVLYYDHIEKQQPNLIDKGWIVPSGFGDGIYKVSVAFRNGSMACSSKFDPDLPLGDNLIVNPDGIRQALPLTVRDAARNGWVRGSCILGMGVHWFRDLSSWGSMTWQASQLLPVVMMYDEVSDNPTMTVNAFFFASSVVQQSFVPPSANQWEPIPLPDRLMCGNLCNASCTFHGTDFYSTLHIYMNDRSRVTCRNNCTMACCN